MGHIFSFIFWVVLILYVLLETEAVPKWGEFLNIKCLKCDEYKEKQKIFGDIKYKTFLQTVYPNFFIHLLCCQECLCVWLNIVGFIIFSDKLGGWENFGVTTLASFIAIAAFNFILKKLYE